jgi:hypothetical protein
VQAFANWLGPLKMNRLGLQFHGSDSKQPDANFIANCDIVSSRTGQSGTVGAVVYFCPFRGGERGFDFRRETDRRQYVQRLVWAMKQGAVGVEVDYNDWPDQRSGVAPHEVIARVYDTIKRRFPNAHVLYCPAPSQYRGMAGAGLCSTLANVPSGVGCLWTGMATLIREPLTPAHVTAWTEATGRRPFLWVNRVFQGGQFSRRLDDPRDAWVFRGELLPANLHDLFEGVHFNAGLSSGYNALPRRFTRSALAYLATAADYVWNPHGWDAAVSARAAQCFVDTFVPLLPERGNVRPPRRALRADDAAWRPASGRWYQAEDGIEGDAEGAFAIAASRAVLPRGSRLVTVEVEVEILRTAGNRNAFLIVGQHRESEEYYLAGVAAASGHWWAARARAGATTHRMLRQEPMADPRRQRRRLRATADYRSTEIILEEHDRGAWVTRLRLRVPDLAGADPRAGLALKWGETRFSGFHVAAERVP